MGKQGLTRKLHRKLEMRGATRAVGMANNKNPLHIIIPCHRVIGADGSLTGYVGGISMKEELLKLEKKWRNQKCSIE